MSEASAVRWLADAYLFALTGWGQAHWLRSYYKADIHFDDLHNLHAWYDRVKARPAVQAALQGKSTVGSGYHWGGSTVAERL